MEIETDQHHCFQCECGTKAVQVWNEVKRIPVRKWPIVRDQMLRPVLLQVASLQPKVLPASWVMNLPRPQPENLSKAQKHFYYACVIAQEAWGNRPPRNFVQLLWGVMNAIEESVHDLMMRPDLQAVSVQLLELVGRDMVLDYITQYVEDIVDFLPKTPSDELEIVSWLRWIGARGYGAELFTGFRRDFEKKMSAHAGRTRRGMRGYELGLGAVISLQRAMRKDAPERRNTAVAMALHRRLGKESKLNALPDDIIAKCVALSYPVSLTRWSVVLDV